MAPKTEPAKNTPLKNTQKETKTVLVERTQAQEKAQSTEKMQLPRTTQQEKTTQPPKNARKATMTRSPKKTNPPKKAQRVKPTSSAKKTKPQIQAQKAKPTSSDKKQKPQKMAQQAKPTPSAKKTKPQKKAQKAKPTSSDKKQKPKKMAQQAKPTPSAKKKEPQKKAQKAKPTSSDKKQKPQKMAQQAKPTPSAKKTKPQKKAQKAKPTSSDKKQKPQKTAQQANPTPSAKKTKPQKKAYQAKPAPLAKQTKPQKKAQQAKPTPSAKKTTSQKKVKQTTNKTAKGQSPPKVHHNLDKTFFCVLRDYGAYVYKSEKLEKKYPWMARVIHSKTKDFPHKCSAACIGARLFVTAARCVTVLVVEYTHVKYDGVRMPVLAFVVPSNPTKQMFDDIGIVVVEATSYKGAWPKITLTNMKRTDDDYEWLDELQLEKAKYGTHVVVGYAKEKLNPHDTVYTEFKLSLLKVTVGMSLCYQILQEKKPKSPDFWVPCYHSCSVKLHYERNPTCYKYLGALGAAVIDSKSNTLIGIATWGTRLTGSNPSNPPVGFAIPNSKNFFEDLACAKKVLKDNGATADMQRLCPLPKKNNLNK